jgi:hypothetical protein
MLSSQQKSMNTEDEVEEFEYKQVKYKDFFTKPKYIRMSPAPKIHIPR